jgi:fructuronate reductase
VTRILSSTNDIPAGIEFPRYDRAALKPGIFHLGPGAFFRAHVAAYTDTAIAAAGGDWGIETGGLRSGGFAQTLNEQNGLYTLLVREEARTQARVVGSILGAHAPSDLLSRLVDPAIRVVTLTITEKAYGIDAATGELDENNPAIAADLAEPHAPRSAVGLLVEALALRREKGISSFTPLSCDNLPGNGEVLRRLVLGFAVRRDPALARWIADNVSFPSSMVDRITPASTSETYSDAERLIGRVDRAAVETEPFAQWVIEDDFRAGRPSWEAAGALMVADVAPYEKMKLRMLNGTHSLIAYLGFVSGHEFMRDAIADPAILPLARAHLACASATLDPVPGVELDDYADELVARIANRAIAHRTYQVAMDGTQKLPSRILVPAVEMMKTGGEWDSFALVTAAWMRYAMGITRKGESYELRDPREAEIRQLLANMPGTASEVGSALLEMPGFFPPTLRNAPEWKQRVISHLDRLL